MVLSNFLRACLLGAAALTCDAASVKLVRDTPYVMSGYLTGFHIGDGYEVSSIPWNRYTQIKYAFAETAPNNGLDLSKSRPDQLPVFVSKAKKNGVKALVSVGGWAGSRYFSTSFGSAENRSSFAKICMELVNQYMLDGLDFDYEYPNRQGLGCNAITANDSLNYLLFLQEFRQLPGAKALIITAAGSLLPWTNAEGQPSTDLKGFGDVLDQITIMNYDTYGPWASTAGPNAPLRSACDGRNTQGSAEQAITAWERAGVPASKLVLGVAAYGHGYRVNAADAVDGADASALNMYPKFDQMDRFKGSTWDNDPPVDECGNRQPPSGTYQFWSMIREAHFLDESGNPRDGITYGYDDCSQTPAVYDPRSKIWVSYDNARSLDIKGQYIMQAGLKGFDIWQIGGDYGTMLVDSIRKSLVKP